MALFFQFDDDDTTLLLFHIETQKYIIIIAPSRLVSVYCNLRYQGQTGHMGAVDTCPVGREKINIGRIWGKLDCAAKLSGPHLISIRILLIKTAINACWRLQILMNLYTKERLLINLRKFCQFPLVL